jgi:DNA-dependent RNA polymerase auxiliary subunit epsilon
MTSSKRGKDWNDARSGSRIQSLRDISLNYEGHSEVFEVRPPDVSCRGMFISTSRLYPEGAVLNLKFRLTLTGAEIQTRCEVRYCLKGVGVGVEFVGILPDAVSTIAREIALCRQKPTRRGSAKKKKATVR